MCTDVEKAAGDYYITEFDVSWRPTRCVRCVCVCVCVCVRARARACMGCIKLCVCARERECVYTHPDNRRTHMYAHANACI